jgi:hypothetical protein
MILLALAAAAAQPQQTPIQFIHSVYAQYARPGFSPLEKPEHFFTADLVKAIRKDSAGGEVGYLDGDPLCDCQDYERLTARVRSLKQTNRSAADARIRVDLGFGEARYLQLSLVRTSAGWRIADVVGADGHSLLRELRRANRR